MIKRKEIGQTTSSSPDRLNSLAEGTVITGDIRLTSNFRLDGEINGNVHATSKVVIGENGVLNGNLTCTEADIEGSIKGDLRVDGLLILREKAKIVGTIKAPRLHLEDGAQFTGSCEMTNTHRAPNKAGNTMAAAQ